MSNTKLEARVTRLENVCALQQQLIDLLGTATRGHQATIEALASLAGVEWQQQQHPVPRAPLN